MSKRRHDDYAVLSRSPIEDWYLQLVDDEIHIGNDGNVRFGNADRIHISWSNDAEQEIADKEDSNDL